jgi:2,3-dihydroxybenzoate-AMP ligase
MLEGCVPWPESLAARYRAEGVWEGLTIFEMVERTATRVPEKTAVVHDGRRVSYAELVAKSARLADGLFRLGIQPLDRVVMQLPNGLEFVFVYLALCRIGAIPVMALRAHRHAEVRHFVRASGAVGYVIADRLGNFDYRTLAVEVQAEFPALRHVIVAGEPLAGQVALPAVAAEREAQVPASPKMPRPDPGEVATMLLSGGTTSMSKLIPRTHDDYVLNARLCAQAAGFREDTVLMAVLPLGHNYNLASPGLLGAFYCGATAVVAGSTDTEHVFDLIQRERVTVVAAAVPLISNWLNAGVAARFDLGSLEIVQNGGARLPPELRGRLRSEFGCIPQEVYGTAEGLINMTRRDDDDEALMHSSGAPVSELDEIKVVGEDDLEVADGEPASSSRAARTRSAATTRRRRRTPRRSWPAAGTGWATSCGAAGAMSTPRAAART